MLFSNCFAMVCSRQRLCCPFLLEQGTDVCPGSFSAGEIVKIVLVPCLAEFLSSRLVLYFGAIKLVCRLLLTILLSPWNLLVRIVYSIDRREEYLGELRKTIQATSALDRRKSTLELDLASLGFPHAPTGNRQNVNRPGTRTRSLHLRSWSIIVICFASILAIFPSITFCFYVHTRDQIVSPGMTFVISCLVDVIM